MSEEKTEEKSVEALRAELELQKAELKKLQDQINPPPSEPWVWQKPDYTANARMPDAVLREMLAAVPENVMAGIRADARKPNPVTQASSSPISTTSSSAQSQPQQRGSGWAPERPLEPPPGVALADRLMDAQDVKDRAELIERELKLAKLTKGQK